MIRQVSPLHSQPAVADLGEKAVSALGAKKVADPKADKLVQASKQMESVFVRELLKAAKVGGPKADSGYGSMAVDALADAVEAGGGFGLAQRIQDALGEMHRAPKASAETAVTLSVPGASAGSSHEE